MTHLEEEPIVISNPRMTNRLFSRLQTRWDQDESMGMSRLVSPSVDISDLLLVGWAVQANVSSGALGFVAAHTVGSTKRWTVKEIDCRSNNSPGPSGLVAVNSVYAGGGVMDFQTAPVSFNLPQRLFQNALVMMPGDQIGVDVTVADVGSTFKVGVIYDEEDLA